MNYNQNTNIRYHIYKELDQYRKYTEEKGVDQMNSFAVSVFSAVCSSFMTVAIRESLLFGSSLWVYIIAPLLIYFVIYSFSRRFLKWYYSSVRSLWGAQNSKDKKNNSILKEQKIRAAKYNYEIVNLVAMAHDLISEDVSNEILKEYNYMESIFYIENALKKSKKLFERQDPITESLLPSVRIVIVMNAVNAIIRKQWKECGDGKLKNEIKNVISLYNNMEKPLKEIYKINLERIE